MEEQTGDNKFKSLIKSMKQEPNPPSLTKVMEPAAGVKTDTPSSQEIGQNAWNEIITKKQPAKTG